VERKQHKHEDISVKLACAAFECFVAKHIDQIFKYYLFQMLDVDLQALIPIEDPKVPKEARFGVNKVQLSLNDNFLLLLASMIEHHMQDVIAI